MAHQTYPPLISLYCKKDKICGTCHYNKMKNFTQISTKRGGGCYIWHAICIGTSRCWRFFFLLGLFFFERIKKITKYVGFPNVFVRQKIWLFFAFLGFFFLRQVRAVPIHLRGIKIVLILEH